MFSRFSAAFLTRGAGTAPLLCRDLVAMASNVRFRLIPPLYPCVCVPQPRKEYLVPAVKRLLRFLM
jgi:hypothetical protein